MGEGEFNILKQDFNLGFFLGGVGGWGIFDVSEELHY